MVLVVYDGGAATPLELLAFVDDVADVVFAVPAGSPENREHDALLRSLGGLIEFPREEPLSIIDAVRGVDAVVCYADGALDATAALAEALGLPGPGTAATALLRDKYAQRTRHRERGLCVPAAVVPRDGAATAGLDDVGYPAVLKPRSGYGSRNTSLVSGPADLEQQLEDLSRRGYLADTFVLESLLLGDPQAVGPGWGDYVSVESAVDDGRVTHVGIAGRFPLTPPFRETGMFFPDNLDDALRGAVLDQADRAIRALGVGTALCHTELKLTAGGPVVIEVNGRLGGLVDSLLCRVEPGSLVRAAVGLALGDRELVARVLATIVPDVVSYHISLYPAQDGVFRAATGLDALARTHGVDAVRLLKRPGQRVGVEMGTFGETVLVLGAAPTHDEVLLALRDAQQTVRIQAW